MDRLIYKTPNEVELYSLDYSEELLGDTILSSNWASTDPNLVLSNSVVNGLVAQIQANAGTLNYASIANFLTNTVLTQNGREVVISLPLVVQPYHTKPLSTIKQAQSTNLDYSFLWQKRLTNSDTIVASTWYANDSSVVLSNAHLDPTGLFTTIFISGGNPGDRYYITNQVTTSQGRTLEWSIVLYVIYNQGWELSPTIVTPNSPTIEWLPSCKPTKHDIPNVRTSGSWKPVY